jgi:hypothetical protein
MIKIQKTFLKNKLTRLESQYKNGKINKLNNLQNSL